MRTNTSVLMAVFIIAGACTSGDSAAENEVAEAGTIANQSASAAESTSASRQEADLEFLRMMSNHHEGLTQWSELAMRRGTTESVRADAHELHTKQMMERDSMVAMIRRDFGQEHTPAIMPQNRAQLDTLSARPTAAFDTTYYRMVIDHHNAGIRMINNFLPRMQRPQVRQMAEHMKSEQQREVAELQRKLSAG